MKSKWLLVTSAAAAWWLILQLGCGGGPKAASVPKSDTTTQVPTGEICDTIVPAESGFANRKEVVRPDTVGAKTPPVPKPKPKPKPAPEPEKPKPLPRMWDYGADNCLPCIEMMRILNPLIPEYQGKVDIRIINVYQHMDLAREARIQVIPTQIFYDPEGRELFRHIGVYPRDSIVAKFKELGWE